MSRVSNARFPQNNFINFIRLNSLRGYNKKNRYRNFEDLKGRCGTVEQRD